ncbi:hypothetical protein BAUCODRAFT_32047 [Baudoinia panamericana UAMH 10762]|uniref:GP-PDE domain-containing protein n=1 Tax=Baudoinia panamericana (strain UAMH 10762) TaxID=717646 RepID=M2MMZ3_BAUPA|nr:uncharacterized protein BAUCODRAFT_32047 [Baudoinia panamericana UAMH 10762]EMC98041.1 hypothetical protein BAUCODRAFT_32047 [Baudoinia panamericana UAMH 10762]
MAAQSGLHAAAKDGRQDRITAALSNGEDPSSLDHAAWTAAEYAAYYGHVGRLDELQPPNLQDNAAELAFCEGDDVNWLSGYENKSPIDSNVIIVNFGPLDSVNDERVVEVSSLDDPLTLEVDIKGGSGDKYTLHLPATRATIYQPCIFRTSDVSEAKLLFRLHRQGGSADNIISSGIALVESLNQPDLEDVRRYHRVPLQATHGDLSFAGHVNFYLQVIKPYAGATEAPTNKPAGMDFRNRIGGHRGLGQNKQGWKFLQMGENTIESFKMAHQLGAGFVEFDVQVTKDLIPVIYHDFLLSETGTDAPIHTVSYEQFMAASKLQFSPARRDRRVADDSTLAQPQMADFSARMGHTLEYKAKGFKPNTRGVFIQDSFTTFKETLSQVPSDVPFDIEMKYPMPFECRDHNMSTTWLELNVFIDTVLSTIFAHAGKRRIMFSSFSPELCIALSHKQNHYPVFFLSDVKAAPGVDDPRASSLRDAVHFARRWALPGIVVESSPLIDCPRLVKYVHGFGLQCATYGGRNNEPQCTQVRDRT